MISNRGRSLNEVVAIEAWHKRFDAETKESDLFLHVKFQEAAFGGRPQDVVRFKVALRKAHVVVMPEDPIRVPRAHVRRDRLSVEAETSLVEGKKRTVSNAFGLTGKLGKSGGDGSASLEAKRASDKHSSEEHKVSVRHSGFLTEHSQTQDSEDCWTFEPALGGVLKGNAFKNTESILRMIYKGEVSKVPAIVKVQVRCLREDIEIIGLEPKEGHEAELMTGIGRDRKLALAEEIIKDILIENQLFFEDVSEKYSRVVVAEVIAEDE